VLIPTWQTPSSPTCCGSAPNLGELTARAHERGFDDLHEVERAVLYPNGTISLKGESRDSARLEAMVEEVEAFRRDLALRA